jgi:nucleoside-diphosphate-sugar epimerase
MTIILTGANGGFGKSFLPLLREHYSEEVIGAVRAPNGQQNFVACDFLNQNDIHSMVKTIKPRLIFHLVGSFTGEFDRDLSVNAISAKHLFEGITLANLNTRIVVSGSAAEYGLLDDGNTAVDEDHACNPISVYGLTKSIQTKLASFYAKNRQTDVVIARIFNLATPGLSERLFFGRAEMMISAFKRGEISQLEFGNLDAQRDYVGLEQAAAQLFAIAKQGLKGETYHVGSGEPRSMRKVLADLLKQEGLTSVPIIESSPTIVNNKGYDLPIIYADMKKTSRLLEASFI